MAFRCSASRHVAYTLTESAIPSVVRALGPASLPRTPLIGRKAWEVRIAESGKRPKVFPDTFKLEAVAAVQGGRPVPQIATELAYRTV